MKFLAIYFISFFIHLPIYSQSGEKPLVIIASDFDGTITQLAGHNFLTEVDLFRTDNYKDSSFFAIEKALKPYQLNFDDLPYSLEITQEESLFLKSFFNKGGSIPNYKILELEPIPQLKNRKQKLILIPGLYQMEYRDSFREDKLLLKDYKRSKQLAKERGLSLNELFNFGLDLINANLKKETSKIIIHTMRGQSSKAFKTLFSEMQKDKLLVGDKKDLDKIEVYPMNRPESVIYGPDFDKRKEDLLAKELKSLQSYIRSSPYKEIHIVFAEDELKSLYTINGLFQMESKSAHLNHVYFHVLFTGPTELLNKLDVQNNNRFVTYLNGIQSKTSAQHAELVGMPLKRMNELSRNLKKLNQPVFKCQQAFIKGK
ncbi:MAG: hypothetical protein OXC37_01705 [Bdellovibrionaceae bacterium]|nr:hypothetical protein [Pseudobdellovibrionaceae bacterium]